MSEVRVGGFRVLAVVYGSLSKTCFGHCLRQHCYIIVVLPLAISEPIESKSREDPLAHHPTSVILLIRLSFSPGNCEKRTCPNGVNLGHAQN